MNTVADELAFFCEADGTIVHKYVYPHNADHTMREANFIENTNRIIWIRTWAGSWLKLWHKEKQFNIKKYTPEHVPLPKQVQMAILIGAI